MYSVKLVLCFSVNAQVLSNSVSSALTLSGDSSLAETSRFIDMINKFFDCMNVRSISGGIRKRNIFLDPFHRDDFRLKVYTYNYYIPMCTHTLILIALLHN